MVVQSGIYPLQYDISLPFRLSVTRDQIDLGSDLMESILFAVNADEMRFLPPEIRFRFLLYEHPSGVPGKADIYPNADEQTLRVSSPFYLSEPNSSGVNIVGSGNFNTTDWINDIRSALSGNMTGPIILDGVFPIHTQDTTDNMLRAWLGAKGTSIGGGGGGDGPIPERTWTHPYYSESGTPPLGFLGYSGQLFDIDVDEVFYHPIPRFTFFTNIVGATSGVPPAIIGVYPGKPIFPSFAQKDGTLVSATAADSRAKTRVHYHFDHVASGFVRFDGDVLIPNGTYDFGGVTGVFAESGVRTDSILAGPYQPMIARAFVTPPTSLTRGLEAVPVIVSHSGVVPASGERVSRYPRKEGDLVGFYERGIDAGGDIFPFGTGAQAGPSGFEYFEDCLTISSPYVATSEGPYFGLTYYSPISSFPLWIRHGEDAVNGFGANWTEGQISLNHGVIRLNATTLVGLESLVGGTVGGSWVFKDYNHSLEETASRTGTRGASDFFTPGSARVWNDGASIFALGGKALNTRRLGAAEPGPVSGIINEWIHPTFGDASNYRSNNLDSPRTVGQRTAIGVFDGTNHYLAVTSFPSDTDFNVASGLSQLTLISGPGGQFDNLYDYGVFEPIDGTALGLKFPLSVWCLVNVTGATDFNNGVWAILREVTSSTPSFNTGQGIPFLARISRTGGSWIVQELYAGKKFPLAFASSDGLFVDGGMQWHYIVRMPVD